MYINSLNKLIYYVENNRYSGYDPYDALNSTLPLSRFGHWFPILTIQALKRLPINIRPLLGIRKGINPKAIGLFLEAYSLMLRLREDEHLRRAAKICLNWLKENTANGYNGPCWGYNFVWASPLKTVPAYAPSVVVSSFIAKGIFEYYKATGDEVAVDLLEGVCRFILHDLPRTETPDGICFSYTPFAKDCCYNASLLAAEVLSKAYSIINNNEYRSLAQAAVDFVIAFQKPDGHWNYSIDINTKKERKQIDFHQGYILYSLFEFIKYANIKEHRYHMALERGAQFYKEMQFMRDGRSLWRFPKRWPIQIHNQSQGIITFARLKNLNTSYLPFAQTIAEWTIRNMQNHREGYFYYEKHRWFTNRIPYMRWNQAWMMLALTRLIYEMENN